MHKGDHCFFLSNTSVSVADGSHDLLFSYENEAIERNYKREICRIEKD